MKNGGGRAEGDRSLTGAASPSINLIWAPRRTTDCCHEHVCQADDITGRPHAASSQLWRNEVEVVYERCCGLDVHKQSIVACRIIPGVDGMPEMEIRTFETVTA